MSSKRFNDKTKPAKPDCNTNRVNFPLIYLKPLCLIPKALSLRLLLVPDSVTGPLGNCARPPHKVVFWESRLCETE